MIAIILAAGTSTRLSSLTKEMPKCLLPINNSTILQLQLELLARSGIKRGIISAGYQIAKIEDYLSHIKTDLDIQVEYNPFFDTSNNIVSLWNLRHMIKDEPILIINGDNIFELKVLTLLLNNPAADLLMIRKKQEYDGDDMKIQLKNGFLSKINKSMPGSLADGESIGIMKFCNQTAIQLMKVISDLLRDKEYLHSYYLTAIQELVNQSFAINTCDIGDARWEEVDFPEDYQKVCVEWPQA